MAFNWEGDLDKYNNEISRQLEELEGFQEELQKIIWESWEVLDKTPPNRCKKCDFIVEGKKPSKVKQRIESHFKKSHKEYYQIPLDELETLEVDNKYDEDRANVTNPLERTEVQNESLAYDYESDEDYQDHWNNTADMEQDNNSGGASYEQYIQGVDIGMAVFNYEITSNMKTDKYPVLPIF